MKYQFVSVHNTPCSLHNIGDHLVKESYGYCGLGTFLAVALYSSSETMRPMDIISSDHFGFRLLAL